MINSNSKTPKFLFVVGAPRSANSAILALLDGHPDILSWPSEFYFTLIFNRVSKGHKTASVVMSQGFGIPAFAVDTHIHRLAQRWGLTNGKNVRMTEIDLKKLFPMSSWNKLHLQIIFWGREFCQAKACYGLECSICKACYPKRMKPFIHKKP